jgi:DNA polymerase-4
MQRYIMHIDMDAFFASVEQLDNPALRGCPVVVGGDRRGVVSAASYEARAFGIRSAMPTWQARQLCPHAHFLRGRMERYVEISRQVRSVLETFSPRVEPASIDEAYMDATGLERLFGPVGTFAETVQKAIHAATGGLTASIGAAPVKFLAKIASDVNKPNGIFILHPDTMHDFLRELPIARLPGVGKSFQAQLEQLGMCRVKDVFRLSEAYWHERFGKAGKCLYAYAQGIDGRGVEPCAPRKSESAENTLHKDTKDPAELTRWLFRQSERVGRSLRKHGLAGRVVTLKVKYSDFRQITRQATLPCATCATKTIFETACKLLADLRLKEPIRLIGVGVSGFDAKSEQFFLPLENNAHDSEKKRISLDHALDKLRERYGPKAVVAGRLFEEKK